MAKQYDYMKLSWKVLDEIQVISDKFHIGKTGIMHFKMLYNVYQKHQTYVPSHVRLFATPWTTAHQASRPSLSPGVCSNSCPLSRWDCLTIQPFASVFSFCLLFFPASGSFPVSQLFTSGGQSSGASALASIFPMNIQGWFPLGLTGLISLQSEGLSSIFQLQS